MIMDNMKYFIQEFGKNLGIDDKEFSFEEINVVKLEYHILWEYLHAVYHKPADYWSKLNHLF